MENYSHSKLSTFEQCKYKYKLKYIDKIPSPIEKSIEAHLGTAVHSSLEWLYNEVMNGRIPELNQVIEKYTDFWQQDYKEEFLIVKKELKPEYYFNEGVKFLVDYYLKNNPFNDGTIALEKQIFIELEKDFPHKIIGYIDRLVFNKEKNEYEIHDYKTANTLPNKEKFEQDRQLALYAIAIKQIYGNHVSVKLVWHYLKHNMQIFSKRNDTELDKLKIETIGLINEIKNTKDFPVNKSILCEWCEYKQYCKAFGNKIPMKYKEKQTGFEDFPISSKYIRE